MESVIKVENLKKSYKRTGKAAQDSKYFEALKGISFEIRKGEIFGILGPNGAGKTTTLEILEGLKSKTSGSVEVLGLDLDKNAFEIKKHIGVQLQSSAYLEQLTIKELLQLFGALYHKKINAEEILDFVQLRDKQHELVKSLSGGMKQRFAIAASLVNDPQILFLDEPTTGLDPRIRRDVWHLVKKINDKGITVVITTHYMEEAEYLCDRVAILDRGEILTINNPRALINKLAQTTQVSFFTDQEIGMDLWKSVPEVEKVYSNHPKVILEIKSLDSLNKILDVLKLKKIEFSGFTVKTATLEDVYLDLTGKEFGV